MEKRKVISPVVRAIEEALLAVPFLPRLYMAPYKTVIKREIKLAKLKPGKRILQIGAGSIPFTAIYLAQLAQVSVCAIDTDQDAVHKARAWIKKLGLTNCIEIEVGNGKDFPASKFDAAFVALQAEPKKEIISNLLAQGEDGMRVVIRQPRERFLSQYDQVPENWLYGKKIKHRMITFSSSILITKEGIQEIGI